MESAINLLISMTDQPKLREAVARAINPRQYIECPNNPAYETVANREAYAIADRILALIDGKDTPQDGK